MKTLAYWMIVVLLILGMTPQISWAQDSDTAIEVGVESGQEQSNYNAPVINFEGSEPFRGFAIPPGFMAAYPSSAFVPPGAPYTFIDGSAFATFSGYYTREMLEQAVKEQKFKDVNVVNYYGLKPKEGEIPPRILFIFGMDNLPPGMYFIDSGTVDIKTKPDGSTTSFGVIAKAGLEALVKLGANAIVFYAQGAERTLKTKSRSIGLSAGGAGVPGEQVATNMVGGTGFGSGMSSYRYLPWVHAFAGRLYTAEEVQALWDHQSQEQPSAKEGGEE